MNETFLAFGIEHVVIGRIEDDIKSVAAFERAVQSELRIPSLLATWLGPTKLSLSCKPPAIAVKRLRVIESDAVKFARRKSIEMFPRLAGGVALIKTAVGPEQEPLTDRRLRRLVLSPLALAVSARGALPGWIASA